MLVLLPSAIQAFAVAPSAIATASATVAGAISALPTLGCLISSQIASGFAGTTSVHSLG